MPSGAQFYQSQGRGHGRGNRSSAQPRGSAPRQTHAVPPLPPPQAQPLPPPQQPAEDEQDEDDEEHPAKRYRAEDDELKDEEWAAAMWMLDPRASMATMAANGNKHLYDEIRNITRLCGGHQANYTSLLSQGIMNYDVNKDNPDHPYWQCKDYNNVVKAYMLFPVFLQYLPYLRDNIEYIGSHKLLVQKLAQFCDKVVKKSHGNNIGRLKLHVVAITQFKDARLTRKANRRMNHLETAEMLLPCLLPQLRADPEGFLDLLRTNNVRIFSSDWPTIMYDMSLYCPGQNKPGFLRGKFLLNMVKTIFTGFSSTDVAEPGAYAAALAHFTLTLYSKWSDMDGNDWNCRDFIKFILDFAH
ncbi:hypothetical protein C8Q80DRAFT_1274846 [Daedaleopsis nitida]|nr:hypothetical protein C8Q80DRAFT_1274846 [Daedaleopsis nitida]